MSGISQGNWAIEPVNNAVAGQSDCRLLEWIMGVRARCCPSLLEISHPYVDRAC
jgi:hypothetical protein